MKEYMSSILYMTLFIAFLSHIFPNEKNRRLFHIISGFLLLLVFLQPMLHMTGVEQELKKRYEWLNESVFCGEEVDADAFAAWIKQQEHQERRVP